MTTTAENDTAPPSEDTPLDRLRRVGLDAMSDAEVLALALGRGRAGLPPRALARHLLRQHDGLRGVARAGFGALSLDLGERLASRLVAHLELARRARCVALSPRAPLSSSRDVVRAWGPRLADAPDESVVAVVLDARQRPVAERVIARGTAAGCTLGLRELFALVVREAGTSVVLLHNHPSGDPTPSPEDITFTRGVVEAGRLLEVPLIDHVVIGREGYFSFLDAGLLKTAKAESEAAK